MNNNVLVFQLYERVCAGVSSFVFACLFWLVYIYIFIISLLVSGDTPLLVAVKDKQVDTALDLIENGSNVKIPDCKGRTSLHFAARFGLMKLMEKLVEKGAEINADSVIGTPLHSAAFYGNREAVQFLLDRGAQPDFISEFCGITPLMKAIGSNCDDRDDCTNLLLKARADPNLEIHGISPLVFAASGKKSRCIPPLIESGANANSTSLYGLRAIEHAALKGDLEAVEILFPKTQQIDGYPIWSVDSIMDHVNSPPIRQVITERKNKILEDLTQQADFAFRDRASSIAVEIYNKALFHGLPIDERISLKRCICWEQLHKGEYSLHDAKRYLSDNPNEAIAHFRVASAWDLLKNEHMTLISYREAWRLKPKMTEYCWSCEVADGNKRFTIIEKSYLEGLGM